MRLRKIEYENELSRIAFEAVKESMATEVPATLIASDNIKQSPLARNPSVGLVTCHKYEETCFDMIMADLEIFICLEKSEAARNH